MGRNFLPPRWAYRFLEKHASFQKHPTMPDDLEELYHLRTERFGRFLAGAGYWLDVLSICRRQSLQREESDSFYESYQQAKGPVMLKNYLIVALRNLQRHKGYTFINMAGLAVGIACCLLIMRYVTHELSYDRFHSQADRIFRVIVEEEGDQATIDTPTPLLEVLQNDYPEVVSAARIARMWTGIMGYEEQQHRENNVYIADNTIFDVFDFQFVRGNPATALEAPNTIVLTEGTAQKYFGDGDPLGKLLTFTYEGSATFEVTGVVEAFPETSHFQFDFLVSFAYLEQLFGDRMVDNWDINMAPTYLVLQDLEAAASLEMQFPTLVQSYFSESKKETTRLSLQPLTAIHLHSQLSNEMEANSDIRYIYLFAGIALIILLIACINFMNLATARSAKRAKEVGMRKVLGAKRGDLIRQFLGEAILLSVLSLTLAVAIAYLTLPLFNGLVDRNLTLFGEGGWIFAAGIVAIGLIVGVVAGSYPAFYLSAFQPIRVLKGVLGGGRLAFSLRKALVVVQFALSIALLIGIIVMQQQLSYMQDKALGYDAEELAYIVTPQRREPTNFPLYERELEQIPGVMHLTGTSGVPGSGHSFWEAPSRAEGMGPDERVDLRLLWVEGTFAETYQFEFVAGRDFSPDIRTDSADAIVINESAVRALQLENPIGAVVDIYRGADDPPVEKHVIGVVKDFHYESMHVPIEPLALQYGRVHTRSYLVARIRTDHLSETLAGMETVWGRLAPEWPLELRFVDDTLLEMYQQEKRLGDIIGTFTLLAIIIACLGLFGLASFTAEQRMKEIGVRKVMGASVSGVASLVARDFAKLVALASLVAMPIAYVVMDGWLQNFAYRIDVGIGTLLVAALAAMLVALVTIGYQAVKAGLTNPIDVLRYE